MMDIENQPEKIVVRNENATATYYRQSKRVICVSDKADFDELEAVIKALKSNLNNEASR